MRRGVLMLLALPVAAAAAAAGPADRLRRFAGTWAIEPDARFMGRPVTRLVAGGRYACRNCVTPFSVPADGAFHPIRGGMDFDSVAVRPLDASAVSFRYRMKGQLREEAVERVSADGRTLAWTITEFPPAGGPPVTSEGTRARVGAVVPGAHPVSGEWRPVAERGAVQRIEVRVDGDALTMIQPTGRRFTARVGGAPAPVEGDEGGRLMRVSWAGDRTVRLVTEVGGRPVMTGLMTLSPDGRTMTYAARDLTLGQGAQFTARRE